MMPGLSPKKMEAMMKQMGIQQQNIDASQVIIKKTDGTNTIIENPQVTKINMQGNQSFQITGDVREESEALTISEEDIKAVMEKTNASESQAKAALEKTGDLAEAIMELS